MNTLINDQLARLLSDLDQLPYAGRRDRVVNEVLETTGVYYIPDANLPSAPFYCEINLHGIRATGGDEADVITNWIDAANEQQRAAA